MKVLITILTLLIASQISGQGEPDSSAQELEIRVKQYIRDYEEYIEECNGEYEPHYFVFFAKSDTAMMEMEITYEGYVQAKQAGIATKTRWLPKRPTFVGFMDFLKRKYE